MHKMVRKVGGNDKALIAIALLNAGVKARVRKFRNMIRVVFEGPKEPAIDALKGEGYLCANGLDVFAINGNCIFIYYMAA